MREIFLDNFTMLRIAKGIRARQAVLDNGGSEFEANAAFEQTTFCKYSSNSTIPLLENNTNLNNQLIDLLQSDAEVMSSNGDLDDLIVKRDALLEKYELLRRMTAFEYNSLKIIPSSRVDR